MTPLSAADATALRDQGSILVIATSDGRDHLLPTPAADQVIVNIETKSLERYAAGAWDRLAVLDFADLSAFTNLTASTFIFGSDPDAGTSAPFKGTGLMAWDGDLRPINDKDNNLGSLTKRLTGAFLTSLGLSNAAGNNRYITFYTDSTSRWQMGAGSTAESGGNAGSPWRIIAQDDTGASLGTYVSLTRSTGVWAFTFSPTAPTPTAGTNSTVLATTAFVATSFAPLASPTFTGTPNLPTGTIAVTQAANNNTTAVATTAYVDRASATTGATPGDPAGTASTTAVMMGSNFVVTPLKTTQLLVTVCGQMANDTVNDGVTVQLRTGTGTPPSNGDAVTGTQRGNSQTSTSFVAGSRSGFSFVVPVTVAIGTAYWADLAVNAVTGGTASVTGLTYSAVEV